MEDKKQDVNSLVELLKAADEFRKWAVDFGNELSKVLADIQTSKKEEDTWEMKCPYDFGDKYWNILWGRVKKNTWDWIDCERTGFEAGEIFPTQEAAELELKRRNLLTRFRAFRSECNGDWKPNWEDEGEYKYCLRFREGKLLTNYYWLDNMFVPFGYFKNEQDAERAIELFGGEIKELFVEFE